MVFDGDGTEVAHLSTGASMALTKEQPGAALGDGLAYMLRVPIPRPGGYQLRFAVRDQQSGLTGSAGEFVVIPDIAGGAFALSGIVVHADEGPGGAVPNPDDTTLTPAQALNVLAPGARLSYAYEVYNATTAVTSTTSVWRAMANILTTEPDTLVPPPDGSRRFVAAGGLKLGDQLPPGGYVLQVAATTPDPKRKGKYSTAVQRVAFEVR